MSLASGDPFQMLNTSLADFSLILIGLLTMQW